MPKQGEGRILDLSAARRELTVRQVFPAPSPEDQPVVDGVIQGIARILLEQWLEEDEAWTAR